ncbi:MAG: RNase adapter RapZ [Paracoccaceae bacterium]
MSGRDLLKRGHDVVLITGPSGAGRSTAASALEDFGFEAIDNLPLSLIPRLFGGEPMNHPIAIGVDPRTRDFSVSGILEVLQWINDLPGMQAVLLFLDCDHDVLIRRYSETRRRHPLAPSETPTVGIQREAALLAPLKNRADLLVDTSRMSPHDLRAELASAFLTRGEGDLSVSVQSCCYKGGTPRGADMVMDCRFLRNPHWDADLRSLNGCDEAVGDFITRDRRYSEFMTRLEDMCRFLLPAYKAEGKSYFSIAFGCTGGQHRSVFVAESLAKRLAKAGWQVSIRHRELERRGVSDATNKGRTR